MSATEDLLQDHVFIRRLQVVIEKCYIRLHEGNEISIGDLVKIADIIEQFVDQFHHGKEENSYFPKTGSKGSYSEEEIRKFVIEHEFSRRIARKVRLHLEEFLQGKDRREQPLARYLKTYSVFILDHTSKEDHFFMRLKEEQSLSQEEERMLKEQFNRMKHECLGEGGSNLTKILG